MTLAPMRCPKCGDPNFTPMAGCHVCRKKTRSLANAVAMTKSKDLIVLCLAKDELAINSEIFDLRLNDPELKIESQTCSMLLDDGKAMLVEKTLTQYLMTKMIPYNIENYTIKNRTFGE